MRTALGMIFGLALLAQPGWAQEVKVSAADSEYAIKLTADKEYLHVVHEGKSVKVQRVQDPNYELRGYYAKTGRKCPPFCLQPMYADPSVKTVGEVEVLAFMERQLRDGDGFLIDARTPSWHQKGTIPGSINVPFTVLSKDEDDPEMAAMLEKFGAKRRGPVSTMTKTLEDWGLLDAQMKSPTWDFTEVKDLLLWCNGPACGQSPRAVRGLLDVGYPAEKVFYYRGGMQIWQLFGLTTVIPNA